MLSDLFVIVLLLTAIYMLPSLLLYYYRTTIPQTPMLVALACGFTLPVFGWFVMLYVALKDWD